MKEFNKPIPIFIFYTILIAIAYSLGAFVLSDEWQRIDSSSYRVFLYVLEFAILPVLIVISIIHFSLTFKDKTIFRKSLIFSLLFGFLGPLLLHLAILTSDDGEAAMGYLVLLISYNFFMVPAFLLSSLLLIIRKHLNQRKSS